VVLHRELDYPIDSVRAKPSQHLWEVLTKDEARQVIAQLSGIYQRQAKLLYGSVLRLLECLCLRVKDLDFERRAIIVRDPKGNEDRVTVLPDSVIEPLKEHLLRVKRLHQEDLARGGGAVYLPDALERKYPNAARELCRLQPGDRCWFYLDDQRATSRTILPQVCPLSIMAVACRISASGRTAAMRGLTCPASTSAASSVRTLPTGGEAKTMAPRTPYSAAVSADGG